MGIIFNYYDPEDEQSRQLHEMKIHENLEQLIQEVTGINDPKTIEYQAKREPLCQASRLK